MKIRFTNSRMFAVLVIGKVLLLGSVTAQAGDAMTALRETMLKNKTDSGLMPIQERESNPAAQTGVGSAHDAFWCSQRAVTRNFPKLLADDDGFRGANGPTVLMKPLLDDAVFQLTIMMMMFQNAGDPLVARHTICVGMNDYGAIDAESYPEGYIMIDPRAILLMRQQPNYTKASELHVYLHEFAHQFQFWTPNYEFNLDPTVRRKELAADCVGASLLFLMWARPNADTSLTEASIRSAVEAVGDYADTDKTHHGTPAERARAARDGYTFAKGYIAAHGSSRSLTSSKLLSSCNSMINQIPDPLK